MFEVPIKFKFYDKLKLYTDFVNKRSIFQDKLWDECQSVLAWSASPKHKHIGTFLDTNIVCNIFGIDKSLFISINTDSDKTKEEKKRRLNSEPNNKIQKEYLGIIESMSEGEINLDELREKIISYSIEKSQIRDQFNEQFVKNIITKVINENLGNIEQSIKNMHAMGFGDLDENNRIRINQKGFLMGELIHEINRNKKFGIRAEFKYLLTTRFLGGFIILLISYSVVFLIDYIIRFLYGVN